MVSSLFFLLVYSCVQGVYGYCKTPGWNPYFTAPPTVQQINITAVLVTWSGIIAMRECADEFLVKSGKSASPNDYILTDRLKTDILQVVITDRLPEIEYFYQVIAREDKGWIGVDYNKSPIVYFTTSRKKSGMTIEQMQDAFDRTTTRAPVKKQDVSENTDNSIDTEDVKKKDGDGDSNVPPPVVDPVIKQDTSDWTKDYLVWIVVAAVAGAILILGALYNIKKRMRPEGSVQLDIEFNPDDLDSDDEDEYDEEQADEEFETVKHKTDMVEEVEDQSENASLNEGKEMQITKYDEYK